MRFYCKSHDDQWEGFIRDIELHNNVYEFRIESRSSIMVVFGSTSRGGFACFPDFNIGCHLVNLKDKFWNTEKLVEVLGEADGLTVASALIKFAENLKIQPV
jgi:hypothetical protein